MRLICLVLMHESVTTASAQDRLIRTFGQESGLQPPVWAVAQDSAGFIWIGAEAGLYRFDGTEFRRWAPEEIHDAVDGVTVSPTGGVAISTRSRVVFEVTPTGARPAAMPDGPGPAGMLQMTFDRRGRLWIVQDTAVSYRTADGAWRTLPSAALGGQRPRRIKANPIGGVDVMTPSSLWRVEPNEMPRILFAASWIVDVWYYSGDRLVALTANPPGADRLIEVDRGVRRHLLASGTVPLGRAVSLVERQGTLWVALDGSLFAVRPGEPPDVLGMSEGINSGGPLLVDREGSMWMGSFVGLVQLPEPDSRTWTDRHGLRSRHARMLARNGDLLWIATWGGTDVLRRTGEAWTISQSASQSQIRSCADQRGAIWTFDGMGRGVLKMVDTATIRRFAHPPGFQGCTRARDGGVWMTTGDTLFYADPVKRSLRAFAIPTSGGRRDEVLHDRHDRLWVSGGESICHAPVAHVKAGTNGAWTCDTLPGAYIVRMMELPSGTLWASSIFTGLHARRDGRWLPLPMESLATGTVFSLAASPRGGVWMIGHGILQRVEETPSGWKVLERLTQWQGLMTVGGGDLVEDDDGTIWIASERGVSRVPASARLSAPLPPPVALVDVRVDDRRVPLDSVLRLPHDRNRLELRFAALSFRDPSQVRHQVRLGPDQPWSESVSGPSFRWVDLVPRQYAVEYRASLDGRIWSPRSLRFAFSVSPPWYQTSWALALALGMAAALGWAIYRVRVAYLLGLERQRTRIAMDLHDEVGSGLASVGILSSVLAADSLTPAERRQTAGDIASAAEELGNALSDIVWALDPRAATLEELASRLAEHGERLSARGDVEFSSSFPAAWPDARLDVSLRRGVLLIGLEALHNAVRHASAREVVLTLEPDEGQWALSIRDDGVGFDPLMSNNAKQGHGLPGMRRRAEEIGAVLSVDSAPGAGTTIRLRFDLHRVRPARARTLTGRLRRTLSAPPPT
jgi:signal transduction histidine kinase/ligand-binding sensor domain-containing protein